jgi:hypothetical protein
VASLCAIAAPAGTIVPCDGGKCDSPVLFDPAESAALFVGVREFPFDRTLSEVKYAVDDAIDLAHLIALERQPRLVQPHAVVLALSGKPQKKESQRRLDALKNAGARIEAAGQTNILVLLEQQSRAVGRDGVLIVSFATHGVSDDGTQYLLTASSLKSHLETSLSEAKVRDIVAKSDVPRSLIFIDACRERLTKNIRAGEAHPDSAAGLLRLMANVSGLVVFSAAAAGDYAYDDDRIRNGVFTAAVMDGLRCRAETDAEGFVTVETLSSYVERRVLTWVKRERNSRARRATQLHYEGDSKKMPLSSCITGTPRSTPPRTR